jgi:predicted GNAT family acetyltransferase
MQNEIRDNPDRSRFEMAAGNDIAFVNYRLARSEVGLARLPHELSAASRVDPTCDVITLSHTEVPEEFEGQGLGSQIVRGVLDIVRARGLKVVPACGFVAAFIRKNPKFQDLLA